MLSAVQFSELCFSDRAIVQRWAAAAAAVAAARFDRRWLNEINLAPCQWWWQCRANCSCCHCCFVCLRWMSVRTGKVQQPSVPPFPLCLLLLRLLPLFIVSGPADTCCFYGNWVLRLCSSLMVINVVSLKRARVRVRGKKQFLSFSLYLLPFLSAHTFFQLNWCNTELLWWWWWHWRTADRCCCPVLQTQSCSSVLMKKKARTLKGTTTSSDSSRLRRK